MGRLATRRGHCFTVRVKRAALVLLAVVCWPRSAPPSRVPSSTVAQPSQGCALGIDVGGSPRQDRHVACPLGEAAVTIRAGGHSYHVPRGWLVSVDHDATATRALAAGSTVSLLVPQDVGSSLWWRGHRARPMC